MSNLKFTSTGSTTVKLMAVGLPQKNIFNANNSSYTLGTFLSLSDGEYVQFSGQGNNFSLNEANYYKFVTAGTGTIKVEGDLNSLIGNSNYLKRYQFVNLFKDCANITDISDLVFPTTVADFCYSNMFLNCTSLVDASTTLPATELAIWCYNSMFAGCSNLTSAPSINAIDVAPYCFYSMFYGCSKLKDAPTIKVNTMDGQFVCNGMFRNCSSLSSVTVNINIWSTNQNENKNWLYGVSNTGVFKYSIGLTTIPDGVKPQDWTAVVIYPSEISATSETFSFDAMSNTTQLKELSYSYSNPEETVTIQVDTTNKPSWLSYSTDNDSINFIANGYAIDSSTSFEIPITLSAIDAQIKSIVATFNISNYPTYTITVSTIPTFVFDAESETDIVSSLLSYVTYGGSTLSCEVEGELPTGLSCVDGVITGIPSQFTNNYSNNFNVFYSASDARTVIKNVPIEIINATPNYANMPLTFKANADSSSIKLQANGSPYSTTMYYSKNGGSWTPYSLNTVISFNKNETVAFSATTEQFSKSNNSNAYQFVAQGTNGSMEIYGNIRSLINMSAPKDYCFARNLLFCDVYGNVENLILPSGEIPTRCMEYLFFGDHYLSTGPALQAGTYYNAACRNMFYDCPRLQSLTAYFTSWGSYNAFDIWLNSVQNGGIFYCPTALGTNETITRGTSNCPNNWTVVNID